MFQPSINKGNVKTVSKALKKTKPFLEFKICTRVRRENNITIADIPLSSPTLYLKQRQVKGITIKMLNCNYQFPLFYSLTRLAQYHVISENVGKRYSLGTSLHKYVEKWKIGTVTMVLNSLLLSCVGMVLVSTPGSHIFFLRTLYTLYYLEYKNLFIEILRRGM